MEWGAVLVLMLIWHVLRVKFCVGGSDGARALFMSQVSTSEVDTKHRNTAHNALGIYHCIGVLVLTTILIVQHWDQTYDEWFGLRDPARLDALFTVQPWWPLAFSGAYFLSDMMYVHSAPTRPLLLRVRVHVHMPGRMYISAYLLMRAMSPSSHSHNNNNNNITDHHRHSPLRYIFDFPVFLTHHIVSIVLIASCMVSVEMRFMGVLVLFAAEVGGIMLSIYYRFQTIPMYAVFCVGYGLSRVAFTYIAYKVDLACPRARLIYPPPCGLPVLPFFASAHPSSNKQHQHTRIFSHAHLVPSPAAVGVESQESAHHRRRVFLPCGCACGDKLALLVDAHDETCEKDPSSEER